MSNYILVVDDEPDVRQLFKITLSMAGHRIEVASDGLEAMDAIAKELPGLVLLDLMMPRLDGFGVLDRLRDEKPDDDLKVLIATAKSIEDRDKETLEAWPVVGVLNKGELDLKKMVGLIDDLLSGQPAKAATPPAAASSNGKPAPAEAHPPTVADGKPAAADAHPPAAKPSPSGNGKDLAAGQGAADKPSLGTRPLPAQSSNGKPAPAGSPNGKPSKTESDASGQP